MPVTLAIPLLVVTANTVHRRTEDSPVTDTAEPGPDRRPSRAADAVVARSSRTTPRSTSTGTRPWSTGLWFMQPERLSLYGTDLWEPMDEQQRIELSRHELASIASVGLWFEIILMQMMLRDVYDEDPRGRTAVRTHRDRRRVPAFGDVRPALVAQARRPGVRRDTADPPARAAVQAARPRPQRLRLDPGRRGDPGPLAARRDQGHPAPAGDPDGLPHPRPRGGAAHDASPATRSSARCRGSTGAQLLWHQTVTAQTSFMVARALVNPEIYRSVGIDPAEGRRTALGNPHYRETMQWMGEKPLAFLRQNDLLPAHQEKVWRASLLLALGCRFPRLAGDPCGSTAKHHPKTSGIAVEPRPVCPYDPGRPRTTGPCHSG